MNKKISSEELYAELHKWAKELKNTYQKTFNPKLFMTLGRMTSRFSDYNPTEMAKTLKSLIETKQVLSNIDDKTVFPSEAYFYPANLDD